MLASNHMSYLDPVILGSMAPRQLCFLAKQELFRNIFFGTFLKKLDVFPLKRNSADFSALRLAQRLLQAGKALLLFPQGTRIPVLQRSDFQKGVGFLAQRMRVPVVPVRIFGTDIALSPGSKKITRTDISVIFGTPLWIGDAETPESFTNRLFDEIQKLSLTKKSFKR